MGMGGRGGGEIPRVLWVVMDGSGWAWWGRTVFGLSSPTTLHTSMMSSEKPTSFRSRARTHPHTEQRKAQLVQVHHHSRARTHAHIHTLAMQPRCLSLADDHDTYHDTLVIQPRYAGAWLMTSGVYA